MQSINAFSAASETFCLQSNGCNKCLAHATYSSQPFQTPNLNEGIRNAYFYLAIFSSCNFRSNSCACPLAPITSAATHNPHQCSAHQSSTTAHVWLQLSNQERCSCTIVALELTYSSKAPDNRCVTGTVPFCGAPAEFLSATKHEQQ